ncbi:MAG: BCD family MFS transporter [Chloroflexaceae bacterium]|jgi:BCD family chlorophyll transporter-like MFS transporter|nr:BCD family MFS transporter [Chloroflexaceae bacterium]
MKQPHQQFSVLRSIKIGSFHIGSSFADLLTSGVLNRVLISDLGIAATPVALLSALRYLLAPLSIWAGYRSDTKPLFGMHRLPYIFIGRLLMLITLPLLPVLTVMLAADPASPLAWLLATLTFLVYGVGTLLSGSVFLALVGDSAPPEKRGQALSIVQIFLVVSFPLAAVVYGRLMPVYDQWTFWQIVLLGAGVSACFWFLSLFGEERRGETQTAIETSPPFRQLISEMWADRRARGFFLFLALGATSAFAQDAILEPFGGDVFGLNAGETTRFNAYWGIGVLISMVVTILLTRRRQAHEQVSTTVLGLVCTALPLALLGGVALTGMQELLRPVLVLFGLGFGIYTVGAVSLLMAMTSVGKAGAYLGLWSLAQLLFRGVGIFLGGFLRDVGLELSGSFSIAYASVFILEAVGLLVCVWLVLRVDVPGFARQRPVAAPAPLAALAD